MRDAYTFIDIKFHEHQTKDYNLAKYDKSHRNRNIDMLCIKVTDVNMNFC